MTPTPNTPLGPACQTFDESAEDLALGMVDEPRRSELLDHAATCARCRATLDGLGSVVDRLLLVAPEIEPPAGFESRVLARLDLADGPTVRRTPWWAVAAAVVLLLAGGFVAARLIGGASDRATDTAQIVSSAGAHVGDVHLVATPVPHVLVTIDAPRPNPGVRHCELQRADGTWVEVGTWEVSDLTGGVWAVGIDAALLDTPAMRITDDAGTVLATATFG